MVKRGWWWVCAGLLGSLLILPVAQAVAQPEAPKPKIDADILLRGGTVVDGTGAPARAADVALRGDRIVAVGEDLSKTVQPKRIIAVNGLIISPGFIDLHTHSDGPLTSARTKGNRNYLMQGVTTVVTGNCGSGPVDVEDYFRTLSRNGIGSNVIHLMPHGSIRRTVLGNGPTQPNDDQLERMRNLVRRGMDAGAWGMSTGLIYLPGRYAKTAELTELAKVVAPYGGIYASHIRDEGGGLMKSVEEAIQIGKGSGAPVHVSHIKASGRSNWGTINAACDRIEQARGAGQAVTADQYPYVASSTQLAAMVVPEWARRGGAEEFRRLAADPTQGPKLRREILQELKERDGGKSVRIARYATKPDRVGKDLAAIAEAEKTTPLEVVLDIESHGGAQAISFGMDENDVRSAMKRPFVATASDGSSHLPGGADRPHPRSYGTFPRKVRYALDEKVISLEHAIRSCSALPAEILHLADRGVIRVGAYADVLVFDPARFRDIATFDDSTRFAQGIEYLFVNGRAVIEEGRFRNDVLAGRVLRPKSDGAASLILKVGRIWTGDPARPWAEALAARDGVILAVGSSADVEPLRGPSTKIVERPDAFALPGLIDAHAHLLSLGSAEEDIDVRGVRSPEEVARKVKERMEQVPGDGWIIGRNWDQSLWPGGEFPTAAVLDAVAPNRPVWLTRVDGHAGWTNSEALRRAKVTAETQPPSDGQIIRHPDGTPTGVFIDGAEGLIARAIPSISTEVMARRLLLAQKRALEAGLTGIHDAGVSATEAEVFRTLERDGKLKLRVYAMASPPEGREARFVSKPPTPSGPDARFEMRAIKLFMDGAMGSRGGLLFEPYADDPKNHGLMLISPETLRETTTEALKHGWQVCTHAIGDKANALVLDAYEAARKAVPSARDPRLRIEHAQVVRRADVERFKAAGVIASMQLSHAGTDKRWADARLGPGRVDGAYAWRWFADAGVPLAFGSDFPVEVVNPFWGIYAGLTRQDESGEPSGGWHAEHLLTMDQVLKGHTQGAAFATFAENRLGTLKPGLRADVTVVDTDLFKAMPAAVLKTKVRATIIDGEVVYESR